MKMKNVVTVIDVGNTKVCCCIANVFNDGSFDIIGVGYCVCLGMKSGVIINMESVEKSIATAVENAEQMANTRIHSAYISVCGKNVQSHILNMSVKIGGRIITENDILNIFKQLDDSDVQAVVHSIPVWYEIDSLIGVKDPVGMFANKLSVSMHIITAPRIQLQNLLLCLTKCHLESDGIISANYATGIGIMEDEDMSTNQTVIDFGGSITTISFFFNGIFCGAEIVPIGAQHITKDIVYDLNVSEANAERMKTLYGSAIPSLSDERDILYAPVREEEDVINLQQIPKSALNRIVQARVDEILQKVKYKIDNSRFKSDFSRNILITGGGSLLTGIRDVAGNVLKRPVIQKKIKAILPKTDIQINHNFSVALGMIKLAQLIDAKNNTKGNKKNRGIFKKTLNWLEKNL